MTIAEDTKVRISCAGPLGVLDPESHRMTFLAGVSVGRGETGRVIGPLPIRNEKVHWWAVLIPGKGVCPVPEDFLEELGR